MQLQWKTQNTSSLFAGKKEGSSVVAQLPRQLARTEKNARKSLREHSFGTVLAILIPVNPLRPNNDLSQTSHCNIKGLSVRDVMRIENMITQVKFY